MVETISEGERINALGLSARRRLWRLEDVELETVKDIVYEAEVVIKPIIA